MTKNVVDLRKPDDSVRSVVLSLMQQHVRGSRNKQLFFNR